MNEVVLRLLIVVKVRRVEIVGAASVLHGKVFQFLMLICTFFSAIPWLQLMHHIAPTWIVMWSRGTYHSFTSQPGMGHMTEMA